MLDINMMKSKTNDWFEEGVWVLKTRFPEESIDTAYQIYEITDDGFCFLMRHKLNPDGSDTYCEDGGPTIVYELKRINKPAWAIDTM